MHGSRQSNITFSMENLSWINFVLGYFSHKSFAFRDIFQKQMFGEPWELLFNSIRADFKCADNGGTINVHSKHHFDDNFSNTLPDIRR